MGWPRDVKYGSVEVGRLCLFYKVQKIKVQYKLENYYSLTNVNMKVIQ